MSEPDKIQSPLLKKAVPEATDGVFFNISAKPQAPEKASSADSSSQGAAGTTSADPELPTYLQVADLSPPNYIETVVLNSDIAEVVFEGIPVGGYFSFIMSCLIAVTFQYIGFLVAFFIAPTYSGKYGAVAGLGLTVAFISTSMEDEASANSRKYQHPSAHSRNQDSTASYISMVSMAVGYLIFIYSMLAYRRIRILAKKYLIESAGV